MAKRLGSALGPVDLDVTFSMLHQYALRASSHVATEHERICSKSHIPGYQKVLQAVGPIDTWCPTEGMMLGPLRAMITLHSDLTPTGQIKIWVVSLTIAVGFISEVSSDKVADLLACHHRQSSKGWGKARRHLLSDLICTAAVKIEDNTEMPPLQLAPSCMFIIPQRKKGTRVKARDRPRTPHFMFRQ